MKIYETYKMINGLPTFNAYPTLRLGRLRDRAQQYIA